MVQMPVIGISIKATYPADPFVAFPNNCPHNEFGFDTMLLRVTEPRQVADLLPITPSPFQPKFSMAFWVLALPFVSIGSMTFWVLNPPL